jgi:hypothetical protein
VEGAHTAQRRPSDNLAELQDQLLRELERLAECGTGEPDLCSAYILHATSLLWQEVARGDLEAPRRFLDHILEAEPLLAAYLPEIPEPRARIALELASALLLFRTADRALEGLRLESRLASHERSQLEREVLRVLLKHPERYLRRRDVYAELALPDAPTSARVGQVLAQGRAQGSSATSFYCLSPHGLDLCRRLQIGQRPAEVVAALASSPAGKATLRENGMSQVLDYLSQATQIVETFVRNAEAVPITRQEEEAEPGRAL